MSARLDAIREEARALGADGALITALHDIRWATGFTGSNALLLVLPGASHLITDGRYREQAAREVAGCAIHVPGYELAEQAAALVSEASTVLVRQADALSLAEARKIERAFSSTRWVDAEELMTRHLARKSSGEVAAIRSAQRITDAVFMEVLDFVRAGVTEREVAAEIVYRHLQKGAQRMSFEPIVASGPNSALPHARPTDRVLGDGDVVVLDFGCVVDGYASDMTRTVAVGNVEDEAHHVYEVVLAAQRAALGAARAGVTAAQLDAAARDVITEAGYGAFFSHSLGHGIGLRTHEWPRLSRQTPDVLPTGCAVTIEPGIYLPGRFGVRIEDLIVLRDDGCENLTASPKSFVTC